MKNTINKTLEAITDYLNELNNADLVAIHNEYCQSCNYSDDEIYSNDEEFFNTYFENKVLDAVRAVSFGDYRYQDEHIIFNGYGNLETFNNPENHVDISAIAADILENEGNYYGIELVTNRQSAFLMPPAQLLHPLTKNIQPILMMIKKQGIFIPLF